MNIIKLESVFEIAISDKFNSIQCSKVKHTHKKRSKLQTPFHFEQKKNFHFDLILYFRGQFIQLVCSTAALQKLERNSPARRAVAAMTTM